MITPPEQMQRILETLFPRSVYANQPAPVEIKVEVKLDDTKVLTPPIEETNAKD